MVPIRAKGGGAGGAAGSAKTGGGGGGATAGGGGRREEENSGRSRVVDSEVRGIARKGLPGFTNPAAGVGVSTTTGVVGVDVAGLGRAVLMDADPSRGHGDPKTQVLHCVSLQ